MNRREFIKLGALSIPAIGSVSLDVYPQDDFSYESFWEDIERKIKEFNIKHRGVDISIHPALQKTPTFCYSRELFHISVAQAWGCPPSKLSEMPYDDKVNIYAWYVAQKQTEAIALYHQAEEQRRQKNENSR